MTPDITYTTVRVHSANVVVVSSVADELSDEKVDHSIVFTWNSGRWTKKPIASAVVAICSIVKPSAQLFSVCATGEIVVASKTGFADEQVDTSVDGPSPLAPLRAACALESQIFVCGMARRVYRRTEKGSWQAIDEGVFVPRGQRREGIGFLCIDGGMTGVILTGGYKGEIWHYNGEIWERQDSPTNLALTSMSHDLNGIFYIAGMAGTLIRGRAGAWEAVRQDATTDDFWSTVIFKGVPYFATNRALYRLVGDNLERVDLSSLGPITTGHLDCDSEVMWSVGSKHLAQTRDGISWESVPGPS